MRYFNGFSLRGENIFFKEQLVESNYSVAGFSYGAQRAFEYVYNSTERIDRLILISPAFFQNHKESYIKRQLKAYERDSKNYCKLFLENVKYPSSISLDEYLKEGSVEELESLLSYEWSSKKIEELIVRGVIIEVFIGEKDKIVNAQKSFKFFSELVTVYFIKDVGHLLKN